MIQRNRKRRPVKRTTTWGWWPASGRKLLLVAGVMFMGVWLFEGTGILKYYRMTSELTRMEREILELTRVNQALADEIHRIETDPLELEKLARERLGYVRKGETVYQLVETP